jgi:hypothetical protein
MGSARSPSCRVRRCTHCRNSKRIVRRDGAALDRRRHARKAERVKRWSVPLAVDFRGGGPGVISHHDQGGRYRRSDVTRCASAVVVAFDRDDESADAEPGERERLFHPFARSEPAAPG